MQGVQVLGSFAKCIERDVIANELLPLFKLLAADEQDSVRLLAVQNCSQLAHALSPIEAKPLVGEVLRSFGADKSWRVRYAVAEQVAPFAEVLGKDEAVAELVPVYLQLLEDRQGLRSSEYHIIMCPTVYIVYIPLSCFSEAEVRAMSASQLSAFARLLPIDTTILLLLPRLDFLIRDASHNVRSALAHTIIQLGTVIGKVRNAP